LKSSASHIPVLLDEIIELLQPSPGDIVVDATLGAGGHAQVLLERISPNGTLIGFDRDPDAIKVASQNLSSRKSNSLLVTVSSSFAVLGDQLKSRGYRRVDAVLFDLGLSSLQLEAGRGFSFLESAPLDMRFDPKGDLTAEEIVNSYSKERLADILWQFGEERASRRIAQAIYDERRQGRITDTQALAEIVAVAKGGRRGKTHPATQTFQALRIAVNEELGEIARALPQALDVLSPGGRLAVISFHSLEDRIVKNLFRNWARAGEVRLMTKKPIVAERSEILQNPRSRSAKLRVIEKIGE